MKIHSQTPAQNMAALRPANPDPKPEKPETPEDGFQPSEGTPVYVKAGKWALAAGATAAAGALGYYAGSGAGLTQAVVGTAAGAFTGAVGLGTVGLFADIMNPMSNSDLSTKAMIAGGVLGAVAGGATGAFAANGFAGAVLAAGAGLGALALTAAATNILRD